MAPLPPPPAPTTQSTPSASPLASLSQALHRAQARQRSSISGSEGTSTISTSTSTGTSASTIISRSAVGQPQPEPRPLHVASIPIPSTASEPAPGAGPGPAPPSHPSSPELTSQSMSQSMSESMPQNEPVESVLPAIQTTNLPSRLGSEGQDNMLASARSSSLAATSAIDTLNLDSANTLPTPTWNVPLRSLAPDLPVVPGSDVGEQASADDPEPEEHEYFGQRLSQPSESTLLITPHTPGPGGRSGSSPWGQFQGHKQSSSTLSEPYLTGTYYDLPLEAEGPWNAPRAPAQARRDVHDHVERDLSADQSRSSSHSGGYVSNAGLPPWRRQSTATPTDVGAGRMAALADSDRSTNRQAPTLAELASSLPATPPARRVSYAVPGADADLRRRQGTDLITMPPPGLRSPPDSGASTPTERNFLRSSVIQARASTATLVDSQRRSLASLLDPGPKSKSFLSTHRASMATLVAPQGHKRAGSDGKPEGPIGGGPPRGGPPGGKPPLEFGSHSLFDPKLRPLLQPIFRGYLPFIAVLSIVVVWGIVPIFWGSLYKLTSRKLVGYVINGDQPGNQIGQTFQDALLNSVNHSNPRRLHWESQPRSLFPTDESIIKALKTDQKAWIAVQIMDNATEALTEAQAAGNSSWDASRVVTIWYATARNYQAVPGSVVAPTKQILVGSMTALNINITTTWVADMAGSIGNTTLQDSLLSALNAPQTVGHAVDFNERDVNPFDQTVTVATTFVGLIYILLLAFNITMALFGARQAIMPFLKFKHLLLLRLLIPLATNLLVAFLFSLVNLPFQVRFQGYGAGGFFAFFAIMYTGMMVLGLCVEVALEILGPKFVAFGLLFLVILNVSGAGYPIPMLNDFYRISYAMPFYNLRLAFIGLLFSQGRGIDIFIAWVILVAWLVLLLAIFPLLVRREQRKAIKMRKAARAGAGPGGGGASPAMTPPPAPRPDSSGRDKDKDKILPPLPVTRGVSELGVLPVSPP